MAASPSITTNLASSLTSLLVASTPLLTTNLKCVVDGESKNAFYTSPDAYEYIEQLIEGYGEINSKLQSVISEHDIVIEKHEEQISYLKAGIEASQQVNSPVSSIFKSPKENDEYSKNEKTTKTTEKKTSHDTNEKKQRPDQKKNQEEQNETKEKIKIENNSGEKEDEVNSIIKYIINKYSYAHICRFYLDNFGEKEKEKEKEAQSAKEERGGEGGVENKGQDEQQKEAQSGISKKICRTSHYCFELLHRDLFENILSFCDMAEYHVLRFVCKSMHFISHDYNTKNIKDRHPSNDFRTGIEPELVDMGVIIIREGYLNVLIWMKKRFPEIFPLKCFIYNDPRKGPRCCYSSLNNVICAFATESGHLEVLKWARKNNCSWDEETCSLAAAGGYFDILKWARSNGCPWNAHTCSSAASRGYFEALRAALARNIKISQRKKLSLESIHVYSCSKRWPFRNIKMGQRKKLSLG
jgi:hypothetical protein